MNGLFTLIILLNCLVVNTVEILTGQLGKKLPSEVKRFLNRTVFILRLRNKLRFKILAKLQKPLIRCGKLILTDNACKALCILNLSIGGEELVGKYAVILTGLALADAVLHKT